MARGAIERLDGVFRSVRRRLWFALALMSLAPAATCVAAGPVVWRLDATRLASGAADEIDRVLDEVARRHGDRWPDDGVVIEVPAGRWHLARPLRFDAKRSGRNGAPIVLRGHADGLSILSGAIALSAVENLPDDLQRRLSGAAARSVKAYSIPGAQALLPTLRARQGQGLDAKPMGGEPYFPGRALTLARWPNGSFAKSGPVADDKARLDTGETSGRWRAWAQAGDAWAHGYWGQDWADEWIPVQGIEGAPGVLTFKGGPPKYGLRSGVRFRVYNVLEELDEPGEWYADARRGLLLVWPPSDSGAGPLLMSSLEAVVEVRGASHVRFERLVIEGARGDAVVVAGGRDVVLARCLIRHAGLRGVRLAGQAHQLLDSDVRDTGQGGVILWGGDRQTLEPSSMVAAGNRFSAFNQWVRTYRPAALVGGVGQEVRGNLVEGGPHTGLMFYGNDHLIAENVLMRLAAETGDVGAVYTGMDWTARGTVIRHNVLQDIQGPGLHGSRGVYLDDQASGITVQGNLFVRVDQAVFIGGGKDNLVDGNLFIGSSPAIHLDDRGMTWQRKQATAPDGVLHRRLAEVPWSGPAYARYPTLSTILNQDPGRPSGNAARRNAVVDAERLHFQGDAKSELSVDRFFGPESLRFGPGPAPRTRDFSQLELAPDSPALRDGFPLLPWSRMRCTRARWDGVAPGGLPRDDIADCRGPAR